jgi:hypothetical protein
MVSVLVSCYMVSVLVSCYNYPMESWTDTICETRDQRVQRLLAIGLRNVADGDEVGHMRELNIARHQADLLDKRLRPQNLPGQVST